MISRLPRLILPIVTSPSISETTAGFDGLRASNNSVTRGRPPVISPAFPTAHILTEDGDLIRTYNLPVGGHVIIENGQKVKAGEVIVKIPRAVGTLVLSLDSIK